MDTKKAGRKGGLKKGTNAKNHRRALAEELSKLVTHHDELVEVLATRPSTWIEARIAELKQHNGSKRDKTLSQ